MTERDMLWKLIGLVMYRNRLYQWMETGNDTLYLQDEQAYEFVALILSGIFEQGLLEEVCGLGEELCTAIRRRFPN